jgi:hypothetical protein
MENNLTIQHELIENLIYEIRGKKVMLDYNLAAMYGVETKQLKRQVRRNLERFPEDFMFELNEHEFEILRSQIGTSSWGGSRILPMAFTEQGVSMLSSVLNSPRAIEVNIRIIRIFTKLREVLSTHKDVLLKLEKIEKHLLTHGQYIKKHDGEIEAIFELIDELRKETSKQKKQKRTAIGFKINSKK